MNNVLERFWTFVDERTVIRRVVLLSVLYMNWEGYQWLTDLATRKPEDIALFAALNTLLGAAFKFYNDARADTTKGG